MPNKALDRLMAEGLDVMPAGMGQGPRRFLSTSQSSIAGLGQRRRGAAGQTPRPTHVTGRRVGQPIILRARQGAWGVGRSTRRRPSKAERARNQQRFVQMIRKTHPRLYAIAKARVGEPPTGAGLGQITKNGTTETASSWFSRLTDTLTTLAPTYLQYKSQKELLEIQLQRAQEGLPPLETSQYAPAVQIGLDPEQTREAIAAAGAQAGEFLRQPMVLAAGAGLLLLVMMRRR